jgi:hypothetical protein
VVVGEDDSNVIGATAGRLTFVAEHGGLSSVRLYVWGAVVGRLADPVRSYYGAFLLSAEERHARKP